MPRLSVRPSGNSASCSGACLAFGDQRQRGFDSTAGLVVARSSERRVKPNANGEPEDARVRNVAIPIVRMTARTR
jgi:hypothetical protein